MIRGVFLRFTTVLVMMFIPTAAAAQCVMFGDPQESFKGSDAVFAGTVVTNKATGIVGDHVISDVAIVRVNQVWKGAGAGEAEVGADRPFDVGQRYVIFASGKPLSTSILCGWTERVEQAQAKLSWLSQQGLNDPQTSRARSLDCTSAFRPADDEASLAVRFGADAVRSADIYVGEGMSEPGTILFGDSPRDRVEILWKDAARRRSPRIVRIQGESSNWKTPAGVTLGQNLRALERLNGRPFRLAGFGWDYGGTQLSWGGGRLEQTGDCSTRVRLEIVRSAEAQQLVPQVTGDREFASGHPAMQALNPRLYQVWLQFSDSR